MEFPPRMGAVCFGGACCLTDSNRSCTMGCKGIAFWSRRSIVLMTLNISPGALSMNLVLPAILVSYASITHAQPFLDCPPPSSPPTFCELVLFDLCEQYNIDMGVCLDLFYPFNIACMIIKTDAYMQELWDTLDSDFCREVPPHPHPAQSRSCHNAAIVSLQHPYIFRDLDLWRLVH